ILKEYKEYMEIILQMLQDAKLLIELAKSYFYIQKVNYLRFIIKSEYIKL
ncbi:hypothetical protein M406DRAFT_270299, partial [Cryphonectria parasitica EP155]